MYAFSLEENGQYRRAEKMARRALASGSIVAAAPQNLDERSNDPVERSFAPTASKCTSAYK